MIIQNLEKTQEEKLKEYANNIVEMAQKTESIIKRNHQIAFAMLWNNSEFTPQEICDAFGNQAYILFQSSGAVQQLIQTLDPNYVPLEAPNEYTINQDGTVTIGEPKEEPLAEE